MAVSRLLRHGVEAHVGPGRRAGDGDPHRGAVGPDALHLSGLGIDILDLPQGHVREQLVAPPSVPDTLLASEMATWPSM